MKFKIDLKILFFLVLFFLTNQLELYILVMIFAFIHELAHIIVAKFLSFKIQELELMPFGFFVRIKPNTDDYNNKVGKGNIVDLKELCVAIAGPLMNIFLAVILLNLNIENSIKSIMIYSNLLIFIFNIIPIFPLDGGRILKSLLVICLGRIKANIIINKVSNYTIILLTAFCSVIILYLKNIAILLILMYLWILVIRENKKFKLQKKVYEYFK